MQVTVQVFVPPHVVDFVLIRLGAAALVLIAIAVVRIVAGFLFESSDLGAQEYVSADYHRAIRPRVDE